MALEVEDGTGIYAIRNIVSGKMYVGSAVNLKTRLKQHRSDLKCGRHPNPKLTNAWAKHGPGAFVFEVIERVPTHAELIDREQHWIDHFDAARAGYNVRERASSTLGFKHSDETRAKLSLALRGRTRPPEVRERISTAKRGKKRPGVGAKVAASLTGYKHTPEARANMAAAQLGRKHSDETKKKLSEIVKARRASNVACR